MTRSASSAGTAPARRPWPRCWRARPSRTAGAVRAHRPGRIPAAGSAHRRPRGPRPRPGAFRPRAWTCCAPRCAPPRRRWPTRATARRRHPQVQRAGRAASPCSAGTPPSPRPRRSPPASGLPDRVLQQPLRTLSGGQRRRVELARILFGRLRHPAAGRADEPPGRRLDGLAARLPARRYTRRAHGDQPRRRAARRRGEQGVLPGRQPRCLDIYNVGWRRTCCSARPTSGAASASGRTRDARPSALMAQADKMRAKATKARAAHEHASGGRSSCSPSVTPERAADKVAKLRIPDAHAVRQDPADRARACRSATDR